MKTDITFIYASIWMLIGLVIYIYHYAMTKWFLPKVPLVFWPLTKMILWPILLVFILMQRSPSSDMYIPKYARFKYIRIQRLTVTELELFNYYREFGANNQALDTMVSKDLFINRLEAVIYFGERGDLFRLYDRYLELILTEENK